MEALTTSFLPEVRDPMEDQEVFTVEGRNPEGNNPYQRIGYLAEGAAKTPWWDIVGSLSNSAGNLLDGIAPLFGNKDTTGLNPSANNVPSVLPEKKDNTWLIVGISAGALLLIGGIWFVMRRK